MVKQALAEQRDSVALIYFIKYQFWK